MNYILVKTKDHFKQLMAQYEREWKLYMWDAFKEKTCYIPNENCFISLNRAEKLGYTELKQ